MSGRAASTGPSGLIVIDKPAGLTSHQVVGRCRRLYATRRVGHAGTLDLDTELQLEDHWDRLRGDGGPEWPVARTLLRETWRWLDEHGHDHDRIAQAVRH